MRILTLFAVLLSVAVPVDGREPDSIRIEYFVSNPRMDWNQQVTTVEVARRWGVTPPGREPVTDRPVDRYFAAVEKILTDARITADRDWGVVHGPYVRVRISVGGKTIQLGATYSNGTYLDGIPDSDGTIERHRAAFAAILKLTAERIQETIPR